jgi:hypothetical protein
VIVVYKERLDEGREMPRDLMSSLQILVECVLSCRASIHRNIDSIHRKLQPIAAFVTTMHARGGVGNHIKRVVLYKAEANQVAEYREKLTQALAEFGVSLFTLESRISCLHTRIQLRSNISVQDGVAQIDRRLEELVEAMRDVGFQPSRPSSTHSESMQVDSTPDSVEVVNPATIVLPPSPTPIPSPASSAPIRPPIVAAVAGATVGLVATPAAYAVAPAVVSHFAPSPGNGNIMNFNGSTVNSIGGDQITNHYLTAAMDTVTGFVNAI